MTQIPLIQKKRCRSFVIGDNKAKGANRSLDALYVWNEVSAEDPACTLFNYTHARETGTCDDGDDPASRGWVPELPCKID